MAVATAHWADVLDDHPALGRPIAELATPAPLVDLDVLERNIATMAAFFAGRPARLRPHAKTHRAPAIARLQVDAGAPGVTVPKVSVGEAMVDGGIDDVYVANQVVNRFAIERLVELARRAHVAVAVDDARYVADLSAAATARSVTLDVLIEIDGGMGRCGVEPGGPALDLARTVARAPALRFAGIHVYEGHVVQDPDPAVRRVETEKMLARAVESRHLIERDGLPVETLTCGGTGTYDVSGVYPGVTEHQSGSYVYMDPAYAEKVPIFGLALSLLCTVLSRPTPDRVITDGGLQVLADDGGAPAAKGHPELDYLSLSEEHGTFAVRPGERTALDVGDLVEVHPSHCCAAANLHDRVFGVRNGEVETVWAVTARGRSQ
jgi:D-serine deaminase-like pyridoxal phosphate-dependent protein